MTGLDGNGVGWTGCVSWEQPGRDGGGCFLQFLEFDKAGNMVSGVTMNGGLVDATPTNKQGDLDIVFYVNNVPATVAFSGVWKGSTAGIIADPPDLLWIGSPTGRFLGLNLTQKPCPASVPGKPKGCVTINGSASPLY